MNKHQRKPHDARFPHRPFVLLQGPCLAGGPPRRPACPLARPAEAGSRRPGTAARRHSPNRGDRSGLDRRGKRCPLPRRRRDRRAPSLGRAARRRAARDRCSRYRCSRGGKCVLCLPRRAGRGRSGALVRGRTRPRRRNSASAGAAALRPRARTADRSPDRQRRRDAADNGGRPSLRRPRRCGRCARRGLAD